jgi:hypothetical protein
LNIVASCCIVYNDSKKKLVDCWKTKKVDRIGVKGLPITMIKQIVGRIGPYLAEILFIFCWNLDCIQEFVIMKGLNIINNRLIEIYIVACFLFMMHQNTSQTTSTYCATVPDTTVCTSFEWYSSRVVEGRWMMSWN